MRCIHVIKGKHKTKHGNANADYTCRKCIPCMITKRQEWTARSLLEMRSSLHSYYVTLTYNEMCLPVTGSLVLEDLQGFLKRLRKNTKSTLRYIACGEYGEKRGRPHYHLLVFSDHEFNVQIGYDRDRRKMCSIAGDFHKAWAPNGNSYGFVDVVPVFGREDSKRIAAYIAGYVLKKLVTSERQLTGKIPEFQIMSKKPGLGAKWVANFAARLKELGVGPVGYDGVTIEDDLQMIKIDGKLWPTGRYIREKLLEQWQGEPTAVFKALRQHHRAFRTFIEQETDAYKKEIESSDRLSAKMFQKYLRGRLREDSING